MRNPMRGVVTSRYDLNRRHPVSGVYQPHRGMDIAGRPRPAMGKIRAPYAGRVVGVLLPKNWVDRGNNWGLIWGRSGPGVLIRNPDGEHQYIGHPSQIHVKVGDWVNEGDIVATEGDEGRVTGPHLHIEFHNKSSGPANNWTHTRDPMIDFRKHGITPGVDTVIAPAATKPAIPEGGLSVSDANKILEEVNKLPSRVLGYEIVFQRSSGPKAISLENAMKNLDSGMNAAYGTGLQNASRIAALENAVAQLAEATGTPIDLEKVEAAAKAGTEAALRETRLGSATITFEKD